MELQSAKKKTKPNRQRKSQHGFCHQQTEGPIIQASSSDTSGSESQHPAPVEGPYPSLRLHLGRHDGSVLWLSGQSVNVTVHTPTLLSVPSTRSLTERHDTAQRAAGCGRRPHRVIYRDSQALRQHGRVLATAADGERIKKKTCDQTDRTNGETHKHVRRGLTDELFPKPVL